MLITYLEFGISLVEYQLGLITYLMVRISKVEYKLGWLGTWWLASV
jgi:hypothetical protein